MFGSYSRGMSKVPNSPVVYQDLVDIKQELRAEIAEATHSTKVELRQQIQELRRDLSQLILASTQEILHAVGQSWDNHEHRLSR